MAKPYEQEVVLDADGRSLFNAMESVERKILAIQKIIKDIDRDTFKTAKDFQTTLDVSIKSLQKTQSQMRTLSNMDATERRQQRLLATDQARTDISRNGGTGATRAKYEYDLEQKTRQLRHAANEEERIAGIKAVEMANARLRALTQIEAAERRIASEQTRRGAGDDLNSHRQKLALSRQTADQTIRNLGATEAIAKQKQIVAAAEVRLAAATGAETIALRRNLELETARLRATERLAAQQERAARAAAGPPGGGPKGPESRIGAILTPGYAGAAFARTSVYGAAAMAAYGAFNFGAERATGAVEMEDELMKLAAISNATESQMQKLKASIFEVGSSSRYSNVELVKISQTLAQAGIGASQMEDVLRAVTTLATASGSTPDEAVQLVTSALGAFQLQGSEAARVANLMTEALNRTKLTVQQTGQAIQYVGATAYEQNISLETMLATIGAVAQAGVKSGSTIGTGFRQFLVDLQDPSKKLNEQLKDLGLTAADVDVSTRGLPAVLETLRNSGFGAAQAYEGLETRAAAFYLTAKNNVDIIDKLQLSFSYSNAAAAANEKAMNSLTAQWQRFKNILDITLNDSAQKALDVLKNIVRALSDAIERFNEAQAAQARRSEGNSGNPLIDALNYNPAPVLEAGIERLLNGQILPGDRAITNFGTTVRNLGKDMDGTGGASERLRTRVSDTSAAVENQRGLIAELDKELLRLIVQKDELRANDSRAAAETANLTSRFVGLASQLTATGNRYDDLTNAAKRYRQEQLRLLSVQLGGQNAALVTQAGADRRGLNNNISTFQNDSAAMGALNSAERAALSKLASNAVGTQEFQRAFGVLTSAVSRLAASNSAVSNAINSKIVQPASTLASGAITQSTIAPLLGQVNASLTDIGQFITNGQREVDAAIERLGPLENGTAVKTNLTREARAKLDELERQINRTLQKSITTASRQFLNTALTEIASSRTQLNSLNKPDEAETKRVSTRDNRTNQQVFNDFAKALADAGISRAAGRTGFRTAADQNDIYRNQPGATPLDGYVRKSRHQSYQAFDPSRATHDDAAAHAAASKAGLKGFRIVRESGGRFHYEWTGSQKPGMGEEDFTGTDALQEYDDSRDTAQLRLDQTNLKNKLKELAKTTTRETFDKTLRDTALAVEAVNADLKVIAENELAKMGIQEGSPQYKARMEQLFQEQQQTIEAAQLGMVEALVKSSNAAIKEAQDRTKMALAPSMRGLAVAENTASGLGYYSLQGRVPDYTAQLAAQRTAQAKEAADRMRLQVLPSEISATESEIARLQGRTAGLPEGAALDTLERQIESLRTSLEGLKTTRESLAAAFGAEGLLPKTLGEGLAQAAEAYRALHGMNLTFTESLNNELGGAIGGVHQSLEAMFASVLSGSATAGQAFVQFAKSIIQMIAQMAAKMVATQIINQFLSLFGSIAGAGISAGSSSQGLSNVAAGNFTGPRIFNGGPVGRFQGGPIGYAGGGPVRRGLDFRDSVQAMLAKGEWVINKRAVDSVGPDFMHRLNKKGAAALQETQSSPKLEVNPRQEVNVWMVKPNEQPAMGPNDVLVTWADDVLRGGQSRQLIQHIARESR